MPLSVFRGRVVEPGEPLFLQTDYAAAVALAEEDLDRCGQCGMPRAYCRDNENGRARFDVEEEFCWATYRVGLRKAKLEKEKVDSASMSARTFSPIFREGREPEVTVGLDV